MRLPETVLVTSAQPGEGKTTVALGVGRALASSGHRVILIEADLRAPSLARHLNLAPRPGVAAVLAGVRSLDDELVEIDPAPVVGPTTVHAQNGSLAVLLAGSVVPKPHLVLSSDRMHDLLTEARAAADVVIIDAPALATVSDALTLTPALDTCIFVMRLNRTTADRARRALKALRDAGVDIAGVVITGTKPAGAYRSGFRGTRRDRRAKAPDVALLLQSEGARNGSERQEVPDELRTPKR